MIELKIAGLPVNYHRAISEVNDDIIQGERDTVSDETFASLLTRAISESSTLRSRDLKIVATFGCNFYLDNAEALTPTVQDMLLVVARHFQHSVFRYPAIVALSGELCPRPSRSETILQVYEMRSDVRGGYTELPDHVVDLSPTSTDEAWGNYVGEPEDF